MDKMVPAEAAEADAAKQTQVVQEYLVRVHLAKQGRMKLLAVAAEDFLPQVVAVVISLTAVLVLQLALALRQ
jgi:hypothetical protein